MLSPCFSTSFSLFKKKFDLSLQNEEQLLTLVPEFRLRHGADGDHTGLHVLPHLVERERLVVVGRPPVADLYTLVSPVTECSLDCGACSSSEKNCAMSTPSACEMRVSV